MLEILQQVGIPVAGMTARAAEKMAMTLLAVADVSASTNWAQAKGRAEGHRVGTKDAIRFSNLHFDENISLGSYDDVKRKDLLFPENANLVVATNTAGQYVAPNDPTRKYSLEANFAALVRAFGTAQWPTLLAAFTASQPSLAEELNRTRGLIRVPVTLPNGTALVFEPGEHNELQRAIIEQFLALYAPHCQVLYVGDAINKSLYRLDDKLTELGFRALEHEDLPDVVAYDVERDWIFIIEAVHSFGAIGEVRVRELKRLMAGCPKEVVYVTAFLTRKAFQAWAAKIAWETEVWIASDPEHLIHFNGDKFLGPYKPGVQSSHRTNEVAEPHPPLLPPTPLGF